MTHDTPYPICDSIPLSAVPVVADPLELAGVDPLVHVERQRDEIKDAQAELEAAANEWGEIEVEIQRDGPRHWHATPWWAACRRLLAATVGLKDARKGTT